jgi:hypothetical protein
MWVQIDIRGRLPPVWILPKIADEVRAAVLAEIRDAISASGDHLLVPNVSTQSPNPPSPNAIDPGHTRGIRWVVPG